MCVFCTRVWEKKQYVPVWFLPQMFFSHIWAKKHTCDVMVNTTQMVSVLCVDFTTKVWEEKNKKTNMCGNSHIYWGK